MRIEVDYGGTWTRVFLYRAGKLKRSLKIPSPTLSQLPIVLKQRLRDLTASPVESLLIGAKGIWTTRKKKGLWKRLKNLAQNVEVLSDVEFAFNARFKNQPGILLIAGTGSIAYGKDKCGHCARAGGLGPKVGDEGSGYWIGKQFLVRTKRKIKSKSVRKIASLAPMILERARLKDPLATQIIHEAYSHLAQLVKYTASQLHGKKLNLFCQGGLFQSPSFRTGFSNALRRDKAV